MVGREAVTTKRCARHTVGVSKVRLLWYHKKDEKVPEDQGERAVLAASRMKEEQVPAGRRRGNGTSVTSQPVQRCLLFPCLFRRKQEIRVEKARPKRSVWLVIIWFISHPDPAPRAG